MIERTLDKFRWQLAEDFAPRLEAVLKAPAHVVKESAAKLVARHEVDGRAYYVKRYRHGAFPFRPLKFLLKRSQAAQEWRLAGECEKRGVPIVRHVALGESWSWRGLTESVLITEAFDGEPLSKSHEACFPRVIEFVREISRSRVAHYDFHPSNLLLNETSGAMRLIDLHGVKVFDEDSPGNLHDVMLTQLATTLAIPVSNELAVASREFRMTALRKRSKRCLRTNRDFTKKKLGRLRWRLRSAAFTPKVEAAMRDPEAFLARTRVLKAGRSSTVGAADGLVIKRYNFKKPLNLLKDLFRGSRGRRGFRKAYHLELCGLSTPKVFATADDRVLGIPVRSYILMEEIADAVDAGKWTGADHTGGRKNDIASELGALIAQLHQEGFAHRDLKETNILFDRRGKAYLIDLDGLEFVKVVSRPTAATNLRRLAEGMAAVGKLTRSNVIKFLLTYCRARQVRPRILFPRT